MPLTVRTMEAAELPAAAAVGAAGMDFRLEGEEEVRWWRERIGYLLGPDPGGAFVAERKGRVIGQGRGEDNWMIRLLATGLKAAAVSDDIMITSPTPV